MTIGDPAATQFSSNSASRAEIGEEMDENMTLVGSNAHGAVERRGGWSNLRCSRSAAFRKERRHLIFLSVLAGVVLFACGVLGTRSRYSAPASTGTSSSFGASAATAQSASGVELRQESQQLAAVVEESSDAGRGETGQTKDLKVRLYNAYTKDNPFELYPWEHLAEPYKPSTMELLDWPEPGENLDYRWDVEGHLQGYGRAVEFLVTDAGMVECSVTAFDPTKTGEDSSVRGSLTGTEESARVAGPYHFMVHVKYVRREIRSLTDQDREMFFNAAAVMQRVPSGIGQMVYGSNYYSKDYFTRLHLYYGGTQACDHWHQGAGFVTSHMALTLMYEKTLQAINPAVSVPYWDFTLESTFFGSSDFRTSGVFADDWFGEASPPNDLHTPVRGRFAYSSAMANATDFSLLYNSYGVLRAPWNNDPTPFTTRSQEVYGFVNNLKPSGCSEYQTSLDQDNWMAMSKSLNAAAHGHIHETVGGSWNHYFADQAEEVYEKDEDNVMLFTHEIQALSKELWRAGFIACPESCTMDIPWKECQCQCDADAMGNLSAREILTVSEVLDSVQFYDSTGTMISSFESKNGDVYYTLPGYTEKETDEIFQRLLLMLCSPGHIGTMYQATSTNDITFWVLHPTVDRLWHLKRLAATDYDEQWDPFNTCVGHNPEDLLPFHDLFPDYDSKALPAETSEGSVSGTKTYYRNFELYSLLKPDEENSPYMYDNFEWPHCSVLGCSMLA